MLSRIGWGELIVLLVIVLLLFGPKRLPELAKSLGESIKGFKQGLREPEESEEDAHRLKDTTQKPS